MYYEVICRTEEEFINVYLSCNKYVKLVLYQNMYFMICKILCIKGLLPAGRV
jgi:hypothetical protein